MGNILHTNYTSHTSARGRYQYTLIDSIYHLLISSLPVRKYVIFDPN